jgi:hypothetical protein
MVQLGDRLNHSYYDKGAMAPGNKGDIMHIFSKFALGCASAAILATSVVPAIAAVPSGNSYSARQSDDILHSASDYGRRYRRHHDRIDGDDIVAGIGILAGIAIIADIASKSNKNKRRTSGDRYPDDYPQDRYPDDRRSDTHGQSRDYSRNPSPEGSYGASNDVGAAVDICSRAAERSAGNDTRVEEIRSVTREGAGWQVLGNLSGGSRSFTCATSNGVVDTIRLDDDRDI